MARMGGHYAVQGRSRSVILVQIESPYATPYMHCTSNRYISHRLPDIAQYWSNYRFWQGVPLSNEFTIRNLFEYRHKSYIAKTKFSGLYFYRRKYGSIFNNFYIIAVGPKIEFGRITQNNGHYDVQSHSRSPILVPIGNSYATSYRWLILTYILSRTVSKLLQIIGQICAFYRGDNTLVLSEPLNL